MEPIALSSAHPQPASAASTAASAAGPARPAPSEVPGAAPRLDLSRLEPPRQLAEARLEEVTIDGICGVY